MTLKARLVVALLAVGLAVVVTGAVVVSTQRQYLVEQLDTQLARSTIPALRDVARLAGEQTAVSVDADAGTYRVRVAAAPNGYVAVGVPQESLDESVRRLMVVTLAAAVVRLGLLGLAGWWVVRLGLRPIRADGRVGRGHAVAGPA